MMIIGSDNSAIYRKAGAQLFDYDPVKNPAQVDEDGKFDVWPDSSRVNLPISSRDEDLGAALSNHKFNNSLNSETGAYNGVYEGNDWQPVEKNGKNGLYFKRDRYIELPPEAYASIDKEITIVIEVHGAADWWTGSYSHGRLIDADNGSGGRHLRVLYPTTFNIVSWQAGNATDGVDSISKSTIPYEDFRRSHDRWVFTKNATTGVMNIYRNGVLASTGTTKTKSMAGIKRFRIGSILSTEKWSGVVTQFALYDRALSSVEVTALETIDPDTTDSSLRISYDFEQTDGEAVHDLTDYHADGEIVIEENTESLIDYATSPWDGALSQEELWTVAEVPTEIQAVWLDGADPSTISQSSNKVSQWRDKFIHGNHANTATVGQQPTTGVANIGGLNVIRFELANYNCLNIANHASLNFDGDGGLSYFGVLNYKGYVNQGSGVNSFMSKGVMLGGSPSYGWRITEGNTFRHKGGTDYEIVGLDNRNQDIIVSSVVDQGTKMEGWTNGTSNPTDVTGTGLSDNASSLRIGGDPSSSTRYADVDFGEIIIIAGQVSTELRQKIEGYLAHKWNLTANLSKYHPYKHSPPVINKSTDEFGTGALVNLRNWFPMNSEADASEVDVIGSGSLSKINTSRIQTIYGGALEFSGDYSVAEWEYPGGEETPSQFSVMFMVRSDTPTQSSPFNAVFASNANPANGFQIDATNNNGNYYIRGLFSTPISVGPISSSWKQIGVTLYDGIGKVYYNKSLVYSGPIANRGNKIDRLRFGANRCDLTPVGELGILNLSANGGINPYTGQPWKIGDTYRIMFATSTTIDAQSSDIAVYNAHVQAAATAAGLPGTWKAFVSTVAMAAKTNTNMNVALDANGAIFMINGASIVANSLENLFSGNAALMDNALRNENGAVLAYLPNTVPFYQYGPVWTGTNINGNSAGKQLGTGSCSHGITGAEDQYLFRRADQNTVTHKMYLIGVSPVLTVQPIGSYFFEGAEVAQIKYYGALVDQGIIDGHYDNFINQAYVVQNAGRSLELERNVWKVVDLPSTYTVTANTVLEFDFESSEEGELHAIGLTNGGIGDNKRFKLFGTASDPSSISNFDNYVGPDAKHYIIPVGEYFTGSFTKVLFVNSNDTTPTVGESVFSNVRLYEGDADANSPVYDGSSTHGAGIVFDGIHSVQIDTQLRLTNTPFTVMFKIKTLGREQAIYHEGSLYKGPSYYIDKDGYLVVIGRNPNWTLQTSAFVADGNWHSIGHSLMNGYMYAIVDGQWIGAELIGVNQFSGPAYDGGYIGGTVEKPSPGGLTSGHMFIGVIDEFRRYLRYMEADEMTALMKLNTVVDGGVSLSYPGGVAVMPPGIVAAFSHGTIMAVVRLHADSGQLGINLMEDANSPREAAMLIRSTNLGRVGFHQYSDGASMYESIHEVAFEEVAVLSWTSYPGENIIHISKNNLGRDSIATTGDYQLPIGKIGDSVKSGFDLLALKGWSDPLSEVKERYLMKQLMKLPTVGLL